jgi:hypothetical protein
MGPSLQLSRTQSLTLSVPSSSPRTLTKRPTGRRTDSLTLLLLGPDSRLTNLELTSTTGGLIIGCPGGHGSTLDLLLSTCLLLLRRLNHWFLPLSLVATHDAGLSVPATAAQEDAATRNRECPGDGARRHGTMAVALDDDGFGRQRRRWTVEKRRGGGCGVVAAARRDGGAGRRGGTKVRRRRQLQDWGRRCGSVRGASRCGGKEERRRRGSTCGARRMRRWRRRDRGRRGGQRRRKVEDEKERKEKKSNCRDFI